MTEEEEGREGERKEGMKRYKEGREGARNGWMEGKKKKGG